MYANAADTLALLGTPDEWQSGCRPGKQLDELAPSHLPPRCADDRAT
jgi:hypothetical protein